MKILHPRELFYDFRSPENEIGNLSSIRVYPYTDTTAIILHDYINVCLYKTYYKTLSKLKQ